jgi:hypothetical protein
VRAHQTRDARDAGEKKACRGGPPDRLSFRPEGWTSRHTRAWKLYTKHSTDSTHDAAPAANAAEGRRSRSRLMSGSPKRGRRKTKNPVARGLPALGKQFCEFGAQRDGRGFAGLRCVLGGRELLHGFHAVDHRAAVHWVNFGDTEANTSIATQQRKRCVDAATPVIVRCGKASQLRDRAHRKAGIPASPSR